MPLRVLVTDEIDRDGIALLTSEPGLAVDEVPTLPPAVLLERIGDYAESIARQVLVISSLEPQAPYARFLELGDLAVHMLHDAVQSFLRQDADLAWRTKNLSVTRSATLARM